MTAQFREMIGPLEGKCKGLRCWIVGTGPTLDDIDINALRGQYVMALNSAILKFMNVRAFPDAWWVWYDARTLRELWPRVQKEWKRVQCVIHKKGIEDMRSALCAGRYVEYVKHEFHASRTCAETAILLAQFLGFSEIFLAGIDGMMAREGEPYAKTLSQKKQCHFMTQGDQDSCVKSSNQMIHAMATLKGRLKERGEVPRIVQTSTIYPNREQFEFLPFDEAVKEPLKVAKVKPTRAHAKF